jgi:hypothetical protein
MKPHPPVMRMFLGVKVAVEPFAVSAMVLSVGHVQCNRGTIV